MTIGAVDRLGGEILVNTTTTGNQTDSAITALASGGFVLTWTDASASGGDTSGAAVRAQIFGADGSKLGGEFLVNTATTNGQQQPTITSLASGGFVVSWTDLSNVGDPSNSGIKAQIYDAAGTRVGGEFLVNTVTQQGQTSQSITSLASGGFVVSWTDASGLAPDNKGTGIKAQIFDATGHKSGGEFLVNTAIANSQQYASLTSLASGGFVATWTDNSLLGGDASSSGVKGQIFSATGAKVGGEFLVNTITSGAQDQSSVTSLSSGGFVVTWRDVSQQGDSSGAGVKAQIFDASGQKLGGEFLVNGQIVNTQDVPTVTAMAGGGFAVSWRDNSTLVGDTSGFGIKTQVFDASGAKVGREFQVNTTTTGTQDQPKIIALASGALVVSWTDYSLQGGDASGASIKAQVFAPSARTITDIDISSASFAETSVANLPVATFSANGALNASYTYQLLDDSTGGAFRIDGDRLVIQDSLKLDFETSSTAEITVRATDNYGNVFDELIPVSIADAAIEARYTASPDLLTNSVTAGNQQQPSIAPLASGGYVVTWIDNSGIGGDASSNAVKAQIYDVAGTQIGNEFLVNTTTLNSQDNPSVASLQSGGFVVTWADGSQQGGDNTGSAIRAQVYDASGVAVGGEVLVNTATAGAQTAPAASSLATGGFVVTWTDASGQGGDTNGTGIKAQLFSAGGAKLGGEFLVNTATAANQDSVAVTTLESGAFVITWRDSSLQGGDTSKDAVKAQMFDATGAKIGGEALVNTETQGNQQAPAIAALDTGGYVITWADGSNRGGDTDNFGIKAQIFDASGARVGGEVLVNTTIAGPQIQVAVTPLSFGGFVVSWADYSGVGSEQGTSGIKAQMFDDFGQRVGGEVSANTATPGIQAEPAISSLPGGGFVIGWSDYSGTGGDATGTSVKTKLFTPLPGQGPPPHIITTPDALTATEDTPARYVAADLAANDRDAGNEPLTVTGVAAVSGGAVVLNPDGTIDFTPDANFSGRATFSYTVTDVSGFTGTGRVAVDVAPVNDPPVARDDTVGIGQTGGSIAAAALLGNDINIDPGDVLTIIAVSATTGAGFALGLANGVVTYDPGTTYRSLGAGQTATDSFSYTISDTSGLTASATVSLVINGANDAPVSTLLSGNIVSENAAAGTVVGTLTGSDPDTGDTLSWSLTNNAGGRFIVDATTGVLRVANGAVLDFETAPVQQIVVRATDAGGLFVETGYTIALTDLPEPKSYTGDNGANFFTAGTNDLWTINGLGGNDALSGNASSDTIFGGAGNDAINGGGGADLLVGGIGNDSYVIDNVGDRITENAGEGTDSVTASASYTMDANVENLMLLGNADLTATGNDMTNTINGNLGNNVIDGGLGKDFLLGGEGNDTLIGGIGNDSLQGGDGNDVLIGGAGIDELIGGAGGDVFSFDVLGVSADRDVIKDFAHGVDRLAFSESAFAAFAGTPTGDLPSTMFVAGSQAVTADQHVVWNAATGALFYDADGAGGAAQVQIAVLQAGAVVTYQDILLIG